MHVPLPTNYIQRWSGVLLRWPKAYPPITNKHIAVTFVVTYLWPYITNHKRINDDGFMYICITAQANAATTRASYYLYFKFVGVWTLDWTVPRSSVMAETLLLLYAIQVAGIRSRALLLLHAFNIFLFFVKFVLQTWSVMLGLVDATTVSGSTTTTTTTCRSCVLLIYRPIPVLFPRRNNARALNFL